MVKFLLYFKYAYKKKTKKNTADLGGYFNPGYFGDGRFVYCSAFNPLKSLRYGWW